MLEMLFTDSTRVQLTFSNSHTFCARSCIGLRIFDFWFLRNIIY